MWGRLSACLVAVLLVTLDVGLADVCPDSCTCKNIDGLHKAVCSNIADLYKFTLKQRHHNINILDLSHNNITKITRELDRLTEVVTLDLSTNRIVELKKFMHNAKKLVHLNLANNRIEKLSLTHLPSSVSSLDLTNNLLKDVPGDLGHLKELEHLELEGNPLNCSCDNIIARDFLVKSNVVIDNVICQYPSKLKGSSWLKLKSKNVCRHINNVGSDILIEEQPLDVVKISEEMTALKSMPITVASDLDSVKILKRDASNEDDDFVYIPVKQSRVARDLDHAEGSGEYDSTTIHSDLSENEQTTEGSGMFEGSGFEPIVSEYSTTPLPEFSTGPLVPLIVDEDSENIPTARTLDLFQGGAHWNKKGEVETESKSTSTESISTVAPTRDATLSQPIKVSVAEPNEQLSSSKPTTHKTGTYVCIAIIVVLLVGLIGFAIVKGQIRKRRDRRILRQQKRDVEVASKEMVDMNKSLLGKPAMVEIPLEKKINGKYELVPTHESKGENGGLGNGVKHKDTNGTRTGSPRDSNQNKSSSKDNNLCEDTSEPKSAAETSFESTQPSVDSKKDTNSLSSEDIFVPINDDDGPRTNGAADSDTSQPLLNGDQSIDTDFLSPREYIPVYSPDMGRVRIKMTETPKPKTPVLVTRSRSNAGDIIITPVDANVRKSTT